MGFRLINLVKWHTVIILCVQQVQMVTMEDDGSIYVDGSMIFEEIYYSANIFIVRRDGKDMHSNFHFVQCNVLGRRG